MSESTRPALDVDAIRERLAGESGPRYWRSLEEIAQTPEFRDFLAHEFPENADQWGDAFNRRRFLQLMGASFALAGLSACARQPAESIVPYADAPEGLVAGRPLFFATMLPWRGHAIGVLAESHMGRPTKIEGNPDHPASLGSTDVFAQASILQLYDPERSRVVTRDGTIATWDELSSALATALEGERIRRGAGLRVLTGTVTSPTLAAQIRTLVSDFPGARWHRWEGVPRDNVRAGSRMAFGADLEPQYRFDRADVVVSLGGDFLAGEPGSIRWARDFSSLRRVRAGTTRMSRVFAAECSPGLAGAAADHRVAVAPSGLLPLARALAAAVDGASSMGLAPAAEGWVAAAARGLAGAPARGLVVAGESAPAHVHAIAHFLNGRLGNSGSTVVYTEPAEADPVLHAESIAELARDMAAGRVESLVILGGNPVYTAPADLDFRGKLSKVPFTVHLSLEEDETSEWCHWHVPQAHPLESWGDGRAFDGTVSIQQPLIAPLFGGKSAHELVAALSGEPDRSSHEIVKEHWSKERPAGFDAFWKKALRDGLVPDTALPARAATGRAPASVAAAPPAGGGLEISFAPDPSVWDGEWANNGWLQELPKPLTKLTWDNAALMSPGTAKRLGVTDEDVVELSAGGRTVKAAVWRLPGHPDDCVTAHLGYGRTRVGSVGRAAGFDAFALRTSSNLGYAQGVVLRKTGGRHRLACTQIHHSMEGRALVRLATLDEFRKNPGFAREMEEQPAVGDSLYPEIKDEHYSWGMAIDLSTCIGCNACVVACQAENNIPVVGRKQVLAGREMHWIRIDRYYSGDPDNPVPHFEPVTCMHCEKAPCEVVCPVGATIHSTEGLNEMIYNRCVGTRYCSNNCPYKVRRFNFLQYNDTKSPSLKLLRNPNVTVRSRGVMEKCSYCVQRIVAGRIEAENQDRAIRDGEVVTACQQACPARAISFGDIADRGSEVAHWKGEPHNYGLLTELNTRPRTTYLAKVRNT
jgi:MoCo/4Fe-4S cofactor protein with predicted Tat translocation signal